jgi:polysaccharide export outer membrane protein
MRHERTRRAVGCVSILLCAAALVGSPAAAQFSGSVSIPDLLKMRPETRTDVSQLTGKSFPLDAPVEPSEYVVGPGDVFALNIWSSMPVEHQLTVTPEGTLLIPSVGVVDVKDRTLAAVKELVATRVGRRYPGSEVTLTLLAPRKVIVQITGDVLNETKFELNALQRTDNLIAAANTLPSAVNDLNAYIAEVNRLRTSPSLRNIIIQRRDGERLRVDLVKYQITGQGKYNPYLREGDQVFVPVKHLMTFGIGVSGAVRRMGSFEFVPGDSLTDLIAMGFGFKATADSQHAVLTRLTPDAMAKETLHVNPAAILAGKAPNIALRPGDRLFVNEIPERRQTFIVAVEGAVQQPGHYPITLNTTKLSEVIRAAGGFTPEANIKAATLTRARISPVSPPEEAVREQLLSQRSSLGVQDTSYYLTETALRLKGELVAVDFYKLFVLGDSTQDVTLRNYDLIRVPVKSKTVYVFGQVLSPGHVEYVEGKDYHYYIEKASGFAADARKGDVKIIKGNTRIWFDPSETTIEDGDFIWVPKDREYPFAYHLNVWAQVAGIVGTVATVALLINNLTK